LRAGVRRKEEDFLFPFPAVLPQQAKCGPAGGP
jgi:hypothetical protein